MFAKRERANVGSSQRLAVTTQSESIAARAPYVASAETTPPRREVDRRVPSVPRPGPSDARPTPVAEPVSLAMTGHAIGDLSDRELSALLEDLETLDGVPSADVESTGALTVALPLEHGR